MNRPKPSDQPARTSSLIEPFQAEVSLELRSDQAKDDSNVEQLHHRIIDLERQLLHERALNQELLSLNAFSHEVEEIADRATGAQLAANTLAAALACPLALILTHNSADRNLALYAAAGSDAPVLSNEFNSTLNQGLVGRAVRARRSMVYQRDGAPHEPIEIDGRPYESLLITPLLRNGFLTGAILLASREETAFSSVDLPYVEALGSRLLVAWESDHSHGVLSELVRAVASLSAISNPNQILDHVAAIACRSANAAFAFAAVQADEGAWLSGTSGKAPLVFTNDHPGFQSFVDQAFRGGQIFQVQEIHRDPRTRSLPPEIASFHTLMAVPMTLDHQITGLILVFGKKDAAYFLEEDEFLLNLLANQAAVSIERCYLDEELRSTLKSTQLFYDLSTRIAESDDLTTAAYVIGLTAFRLFQAINCGLVLYTEDGQVEASVLFPADDPTVRHPEGLVHQAMLTGQIAYQGKREPGSRLALPIQTARRCYGALWLERGEANLHAHRPIEEIRLLINQSAVALERSILLTETRQQAEQIAIAYHQLEESYDQTLLALTNALEARDHETEMHTQRVSSISLSIGREMGLSQPELVILKRGALLHDIGKIGISDNILRKSGKLDSSEWDLMQKHPTIGAEIVSGIPSLKDALTIIANHHERWNGSGYPRGLVGVETPLLARIFIVADVYDALTSHRSYRTRDFSHDDAIDYIQSQAGTLFDPQIVRVLVKILQDNPTLPDMT